MVGNRALDYLAQVLPLDRLDVDRIGDLRIGHDRGRIRVDQNYPEALGTQRLDRLHARIIELTGLPDHDRTCTDDQDGLDVGSFRHGLY